MFIYIYMKFIRYHLFPNSAVRKIDLKKFRLKFFLALWLSSVKMVTTIRIQILDKVDCVSLPTNVLGKSMKQSLLLMLLVHNGAD